MEQAIWLVRHGNRLDFIHPEWFETAEYPYDPPLSEDGAAQAFQLAEQFREQSVGQIFCSPFLRTIQTAIPIASVTNLAIALESGLGEWLNPDWFPSPPVRNPLNTVTKLYSNFNLSYKSQVIPQYPEGEKELKARKALVIQKILERFSENILIIGHSATLTGITMALVADPPPVKTPVGGVIKLVRKQRDWQVESYPS